MRQYFKKLWNGFWSWVNEEGQDIRDINFKHTPPPPVPISRFESVEQARQFKGKRCVYLKVEAPDINVTLHDVNDDGTCYTSQGMIHYTCMKPL